jgi:hypothetical protein
MVSSFGFPAAVPILMPGGIGRSEAEPRRVRDSSAVLPRSALENDLLSNDNEWFVMVVFNSSFSI